MKFEINKLKQLDRIEYHLEKQEFHRTLFIGFIISVLSILTAMMCLLVKLIDKTHQFHGNVWLLEYFIYFGFALMVLDFPIKYVQEYCLNKKYSKRMKK